MGEGVRPSATAQYVAMVRAGLDRRGVIDDPHAAAMLSGPFALAHRVVRWERNTTGNAWLAARTLAVDAAVVDSFDTGIAQCVILGAGYDSRAWRLAGAGVSMFEVDHAATQRDKQARAPSGGGPVYVPFDLSTPGLPEALRDAGVDGAEPVVTTVEGLTMYLSAAEVASLFSELARVGGAGSVLVATFGAGFAAGDDKRRSRVREAVSRRLVAKRQEAITFEPDADEVVALVEGAGWSNVSVAAGPDLVARHLSGTTLHVEGINPGSLVAIARR